MPPPREQKWSFVAIFARTVSHAARCGRLDNVRGAKISPCFTLTGMPKPRFCHLLKSSSSRVAYYRGGGTTGSGLLAKNDQQEAFERLLTTTLSRTIDFLKFAEAKNAALLTFSSAWLLALLSHADFFSSLSRLDIICDHACKTMFFLSALAALWAFLPRRKLPKFFRDPIAPASLIYFGDAARFDVASYVDRVKQSYFPSDEQSCTQTYLDDLAVQIAVNSRIANDKFSKFHWGGVFVLAAFVFIAIPPAWSIIRALSELFAANGG